MEGVRGNEHLLAPAPKEPMQGVLGNEHQAQMQGVRRGEHLPAPASKEPLQGVLKEQAGEPRECAYRVSSFVI